jgi:hypothetical protein
MTELSVGAILCEDGLLYVADEFWLENVYASLFPQLDAIFHIWKDTSFLCVSYPQSKNEVHNDWGVNGKEIALQPQKHPWSHLRSLPAALGSQTQ